MVFKVLILFSFSSSLSSGSPFHDLDIGPDYQGDFYGKILNPIDEIKMNGTVDENGRICVKKVMLAEYTEYTEVMTCVHKTKEMCHITYVTEFEPHQEQKCDEKFEKRCTIFYENVAINEDVEVCKTHFCPDCTKEGPEECETVYDTVCETKRKSHDVIEDVVNCETVAEKNCKNVQDTEFLPEEKCDTWPVKKCSVEKISVTKTVPETSCREESRILCAPRGCAEKQVCSQDTYIIYVMQLLTALLNTRVSQLRDTEKGCSGGKAY